MNSRGECNADPERISLDELVNLSLSLSPKRCFGTVKGGGTRTTADFFNGIMINCDAVEQCMPALSIKVNKKLPLYSRRIAGVSAGAYAIVYTDV